MKSEISPDTPTTITERIAAGLAILAPFLALFAISAFTGCRAFYENSGSHTRVGSLTAPVEVSDASESALTVRALYSMDGADVWTARDSLVKITYRNCYTNDYFAIVKTSGDQNLTVEIEPLSVEGPATNSAPSVATANGPVPAATTAGSDTASN